MADLIRVLRNCKSCAPDSDPHLQQEWLVTNGLGGYASGTVTGAITRRYHGLLIAALPNPLGRMMMLNGLSERLRLPDRRVVYTGAEELAGISPGATLALSEFRLEGGLPVWRYEVDGFVLEKRLFLPYRQNTVHVTYLLLSGKGNLRLGLRPAMHFRSHDAPVSRVHSTYYRLTVCEDRGRRYFTWAISTWSLPSRLRARWANRSRISWVRSMTLSSVKSVMERTLGGGELRVEYQQVRPQLQSLDHQFREFPLAHEKAGIEGGPLLQDGGRQGEAGGTGQFRQFREGLLRGQAVLARHSDEDGPILAVPGFVGAGPGQLRFQGFHQFPEVQIQVGYVVFFDNGPELVARARESLSGRVASDFTLKRLQYEAEHGHAFPLTVALVFEPKVVTTWAEGKD